MIVNRSAISPTVFESLFLIFKRNKQSVDVSDKLISTCEYKELFGKTFITSMSIKKKVKE